MIWNIVVINDKSQGSVATHLRRGGQGLFVMFAGEKFFKIGKYLAKLQAIGWLLSCPVLCFSCTVLLKDADLSRKLAYNGQKLLLIMMFLKAV